MEKGSKEKKYPIGTFAKLTGVTERTLRFYDRKNLLQASGRNAQGHRYYTEQDLLRLQQILTMKFMDFSLEEIATHLQQPDGDLQQSLAMQYDLLKQKQKQLERVLETIDRLRKSVDGSEKVDSALLLMFIHNIQNEESQKQYLAQRIPPAVVQAIYLDGVPEEEKVEQERKMTNILIEILGFCKKGRSPSDPEVLEAGNRLAHLIEETIGPVVSTLSEQELKQLEELENKDSIDPILFHNGFSSEEETFLQAVVEQLEGLNSLSGGSRNGD